MSGPNSLTRRELLRLGAASGCLLFAGGRLAWAQGAPEAEAKGPRAPAIIVVWLAGGPSQLETFDPHPGGPIGGPTKGVKSSVEGVELAAGYPRLAERLKDLVLLRSLVTTEGEHTRGTHLLRTGFQQSATVQHPSFTAVVASDLATKALEIPPHVALLTNDPSRGGFLGATLDAFAVGDPQDPLPDLTSPTGPTRLDARLEALAKLERGFRRGREARCDATQHAALAERARAMMASPQVKAFDVKAEPQAVVSGYGDTPFGRACLVARRLVEQGVPAVEVTLGGWDSHVDNFGAHDQLAVALDQGLAALLDDLKARGLLESTLVLCTGEFGRTPRVNPLDGRDHWTRGFSALLAGRGLRKGVVLGSTDPQGEKEPADPIAVPDLFATLYRSLGLDGSRQLLTPAGRPLRLNEGTPLARLLA